MFVVIHLGRLPRCKIGSIVDGGGGVDSALLSWEKEKMQLFIKFSQSGLTLDARVYPWMEPPVAS